MKVDSGAKAFLVDIQRRQGHVTLADIKSVLPIESMTPEEVGLTIAQLEDAGIDIEVDEELLRRRQDSGVVEAQPARLPLAPAPTAPMSGQQDQRSPSGRSTAAAPKHLSAGKLRSTRSGRIALVIFVLIVLCLLFIFLVLKP